MDFDKKKETVLKKMIESDRSKKGFIDEDILDLINKINSFKNYYTTSSCSGRITIMEQADIKKDNKWLLTKHSPITKEEFDIALSGNLQKDVWFRQESPIIHLCSRDLESGMNFLELAKKAGFKYNYFISVKPRVILEIRGSEKMETIIVKDKLLIDGDYKVILIDEANKKLLTAKKKLSNLYELLLKENCKLN